MVFLDDLIQKCPPSVALVTDADQVVVKGEQFGFDDLLQLATLAILLLQSFLEAQIDLFDSLF